MAKYKLEDCKRCERYYNTADSDYCTACLDTHPEWAPNLGCGDLGCTRSHEDIGAVCVINPDGSIAMQVEYHVLAASATRYNIEINRAHPAGGGQ